MRGETFGLSCLEFAVLGKPVLTCAVSPEKGHWDILGDSKISYFDSKELQGLLRTPIHEMALSKKRFAEYGPKEVMQRFQRAFLG